MDKIHEPCPKCNGELGLDDLTCGSCGAPVRRQRRLGEILIDEGIISRDHLEEALRLQKRKLGEILVELGACKREDLDRAIELQKLGRTRADVYKRWLRVALFVILLLVVALSAVLLRLESDARLLVQIEKESLTVDEVASVLEEGGRFSKFDALRSLSHQLADPKAIALVERALRNEKWYIQLYAAMLAKQSKNRILVPALIPLLIDDKKVLAPLAHEALEEITGQKLEPTLKAWKDWAKASNIPLEKTSK